MDWSCSGWSFCHHGDEMFTSIKQELPWTTRLLSTSLR